MILKEYMVGLIFEKLTEIQNLTLINDKFKEDFKKTSDYNKLYQIVQQYLVKYQKDLDQF